MFGIHLWNFKYANNLTFKEELSPNMPHFMKVLCNLTRNMFVSQCKAYNEWRRLFIYAPITQLHWRTIRRTDCRLITAKYQVRYTLPGAYCEIMSGLVRRRAARRHHCYVLSPAVTSLIIMTSYGRLCRSHPLNTWCTRLSARSPKGLDLNIVDVCK